MQFFTIREKKGDMDRKISVAAKDLDSAKLYAGKNRVFKNTTLEIYDNIGKMVCLSVNDIWVPIN